ncbi:dihydropyrimidinase [Lachnospiraceae bacterium ZAX-1]
MDILIQGGTIVTPQGSKCADILIRGEKIVEISDHINADARNLKTEAENKNADVDPDKITVISAHGKLVFPGFIDTHTHFDLDAGEFRTADDFQTGTKAAIAGGTTTILDFATPEKGETLGQTLQNWHNLADNKSSCDYGFHMSIIDWNEDTKAEIKTMTQQGITSYKLYMAYDNLKVRDDEIFEILKAVQVEGGIVGVHCENGNLINALIKKLKQEGRMLASSHPKSRPDVVEAEAVNRLLAIAKLANTPVNIVHLSTKRALKAVEQARQEGQAVYVETCPQYLLMDESKYELPGFESAKYVLSPPLRKAEDIDCIWEALKEDRIDTIGTDHCSFYYKGQKERGKEDFSKIPNGIPGVEHRAMLLYTNGVVAGRITKEQMCALLAENPAKLFGLYPRKGVVKVGSDADLVIWDTESEALISEKTQLQNVDYTPYEGMAVKGKPETVFLRGNAVFKDGKIIAEKQGKYLYRGKTEL